MQVQDYQIWQWQGLPIRYQRAGNSGDPILLVHGFGASSDHWRKNIPVLAEHFRVYAIDLLGFGRSAKPFPGQPLTYEFETWSEQVLAFYREVIGEPGYVVGNSIGCVVVLQAAVQAADWVKGVVLINCSLRLLHERKRSALPWFRRSTAPLLQNLLAFRPFGHFFFSRLARATVIEKILLKAYGRKEAVTQELVKLLLEPAQDPGAADVFLAFVRYSQGPLPEELLPQLSCRALILWGEVDPWESIEEGSALAEFPAVDQFIPLAGVGHCPQDEAPELVNSILRDWLSC
jgi:pimeloyl-ACP methyl ester carboxylesterase